VFSLTGLHFEQVIDDAHLLLNNPSSEQQLYDILEMIPSERTTLLFSPTFTEKVNIFYARLIYY
jgi:superfamily II DNA/RNA helicase